MKESDNSTDSNRRGKVSDQSSLCLRKPTTIETSSSCSLFCRSQKISPPKNVECFVHDENNVSVVFDSSCCEKKPSTIMNNEDQEEQKSKQQNNQTYQTNPSKTIITKQEKRKHSQTKNRKQHKFQARWHMLPLDLLEEIFRLLTIKERHLASQVCPQWYVCFYSPLIWTRFVLNDITFTKRKFNYYFGYQRIIDPFKTQMFMQKFAHHLRTLVIKPMNNFFNLYEFMKSLEQFAKHRHSFHESGRLKQLHTFKFTFNCRSTNTAAIASDEWNDRYGDWANRLNAGIHSNDESHLDHPSSNVIGTGGKLLEALQGLMAQFTGLRHLVLRDLLLDFSEAAHLLDSIVHNCYETLRTLTVINCCKSFYAFFHVGVFVHLETLIISPQHLNRDVLELLAQNRNLRDLYLVQNELTRPNQIADNLSRSVWKRFEQIAKGRIKIHLAMVNKSNFSPIYLSDELIYQDIQVTSIIYDTPYVRPATTRLFRLPENYLANLQSLAFYNLPKFTIFKKFANRIDSYLIELSRQCPNLQVLILNDLISTSSLLLVVNNWKHLKQLSVRQNAIRKRFDCSYELTNFEFSNDYDDIHNRIINDSFIQWLKTTSKSYEATFNEISRMLGHQWLPLSDDQFKRLQPSVEI